MDPPRGALSPDPPSVGATAPPCLRPEEPPVPSHLGPPPPTEGPADPTAAVPPGPADRLGSPRKPSARTPGCCPGPAVSFDQVRNLHPFQELPEGQKAPSPARRSFVRSSLIPDSSLFTTIFGPPALLWFSPFRLECISPKIPQERGLSLFHASSISDLGFSRPIDFLILKTGSFGRTEARTGIRPRPWPVRDPGSGRLLS